VAVRERTGVPGNLSLKMLARKVKEIGRSCLTGSWDERGEVGARSSLTIAANLARWRSIEDSGKRKKCDCGEGKV